MFTFVRIDPMAERDSLVQFMTANSWPFHVNADPSPQDIDEAIADGAFRDSENDSYWIHHETLGRIGFLRLEDLEDPTPLFDLRLADEFRGRGFAADILREATAWVFDRFPEVRRFEGQTREDNIAMRKAFIKAGWVKEAHYRQGWPVDGADPLASVAYAVLRSDWESGETTPVPWADDDLKKVRVRKVGDERIIAPADKTWDSFFAADAPTVTEDFMEHREAGEQPQREGI